MTEEAKAVEPKGITLEEMGLDGQKVVRGVWVPINEFPGVELRVVKFHPGRYADFCARPDNEDLDQEELQRAFTGEEVIREIRGTAFSWSKRVGRDAMLKKVQERDEQTDAMVEVYVHDPIYRSALRASQIDGLYVRDAVGNSVKS